jgi:hypothetical protein
METAGNYPGSVSGNMPPQMGGRRHSMAAQYRKALKAMKKSRKNNRRNNRMNSRRNSRRNANEYPGMGI